ncbi:MAG: hypothetical protein QOD78_1121 [Chloroflexota bacterium]|nr:hypothetical protein [Chloroflexota bacterium]
MSDPRADRDAYLDQVAGRLRLPDEEATDVLDELRSHLAESAAGLISEGLTPEQAQRESIARLGNPGDLADGIRTARQTRRRLLAAAGAGVIAATSGLFWGWLFAAALTTLAGVVATILISLGLQILQLSSPGWQPATDLLSIPFALFVPGYAAHRMVGAISARSGRPVTTIQRPLALVGAGVLAIAFVFLVRSDLNPVKVFTALLIPVGFAGGAMLARDGSSARLRRLPGRWVVAIFVIATLAITAFAAATLEINPTGEYTVDDGVARIGAPALEVLGDGWLEQSSTGLGFTSGVDLTPTPPNLLDGWRDLRLEAWPVVDRVGPIDVLGDEPAVAAPMARDEFGSYAAELDVGTAKVQRWYVIATTGIAPNGSRYLLTGPDGPVPSRPWTGTVWEYLTTP